MTAIDGTPNDANDQGGSGTDNDVHAPKGKCTKTNSHAGRPAGLYTAIYKCPTTHWQYKKGQGVIRRRDGTSVTSCLKMVLQANTNDNCNYRGLAIVDNPSNINKVCWCSKNNNVLPTVYDLYAKVYLIQRDDNVVTQPNDNETPATPICRTPANP